MVAALILVSMLYLLITLGFALGSSNGSINGLNIHWKWFKTILIILISITVFSTLNGYSMSSTFIYLSLYEEKELPILNYLINKVKTVFKIKKRY